MNTKTLALYRKFREHSPFMLVGHNARLALQSAKTLVAFQEAESAGLVRLVADPEQESYFDVYGEPDDKKQREAIEQSIEDNGCVYVQSEFYDGEDWVHVDGVGMCIYNNPLSSFENCYVIDLMRAALDHVTEPEFAI